MGTKVQDSVGLAASLDPQLACEGARGWGRLDQVCGLCAGSAVEGGEVKVWAVRVMSEAVKTCSEKGLAQNCQLWRTTIVTALQSSRGVDELRCVCDCVTSLVSRAHQTSLREFSVSSLPPLLSSLLRFRDTHPTLQAAVLPCLSAIHHLFPTACKTHRGTLLSWSKEGLMNSDLSVCRESARLLAVMHSSPEQWTSLLSSSLSTLTSSLLHYSHTLTQTTPPVSDNLNLDLPPSEPARTVRLLRLIISHCRLLSYLLLLTPHTSHLTLPVNTIVGVVSFGLHTNIDRVVTMATDSTLLVATLPAVHSSLLTLLHALITSSHTHLLPLTTAIDTTLLRQMGNEGCVVWRGCVHGALCAWVRVRGGGGEGDRFPQAVLQWLFKSCQRENESEVVEAVRTMCVVVEHCRTTITPHTSQQVWQTPLKLVTRPSSLSLTLAGVKLLRHCLEYPESIPLSTAVQVFQKYSNHPSREVRDESRRGLSSCSVLLHPMGPPWSTGTSARGTCENSEPLSAVHHVPPPQLPPVWGLGGTEETTSSLLLCVAGGGVRKRRREDEREEAKPTELSPGRRRRRQGGGGGGESEGALEETPLITPRNGQERETTHSETVRNAGDGEEMGKVDKESYVSAEEMCSTSREGETSEDGRLVRGGVREDGSRVRGEDGADSEDSDIEDIIASFCSSPSQTDSDNN